jgi:hypothetical protein
VQKCIENNEPLLMSERKKIEVSMENSFGPDWKSIADDPLISEIIKGRLALNYTA